VNEAVARSNVRDFAFDEVEVVVCVRLHSVVDGLFPKDVHCAYDCEDFVAPMMIVTM
jgi:hypothetical protein